MVRTAALPLMAISKPGKGPEVEKSQVERRLVCVCVSDAIIKPLSRASISGLCGRQCHKGPRCIGSKVRERITFNKTMALATLFLSQQPPNLMICLESAVMCAENGSLGSYKVTAKSQAIKYLPRSCPSPDLRYAPLDVG
jgi:hypothetical protein